MYDVLSHALPELVADVEREVSGMQRDQAYGKRKVATDAASCGDSAVSPRWKRRFGTATKGFRKIGIGINHTPEINVDSTDATWSFVRPA